MFIIINPLWYLVGVIIGWILWPIVWIVAFIVHIAWTIIKHILGVLFDGFLYGIVLAAQLIRDAYRRLLTRYPRVDNAIPTIVLFTVLAIILTAIFTR
jgi:hypothetical protein